MSPAPMVRYGHDGELRTVAPACTCGWVGAPWAVDVSDQESAITGLARDEAFQHADEHHGKVAR